MAKDVKDLLGRISHASDNIGKNIEAMLKSGVNVISMPGHHQNTDALRTLASTMESLDSNFQTYMRDDEKLVEDIKDILEDTKNQKKDYDKQDKKLIDAVNSLHKIIEKGNAETCSTMEKFTQSMSKPQRTGVGDIGDMGGGRGGGGGGGGRPDFGPFFPDDKSTAKAATRISSIYFENFKKDSRKEMAAWWTGISQALLGGADPWQAIFSGMVQDITYFRKDMRGIAYATEGITGNMRGLQAQFVELGDSSRRTGLGLNTMQKVYMNNLKKGIKTQKQSLEVSKTGLHVAEMLGMSAEGTASVFHDWHMQMGLSVNQMYQVARNVKDVARQTGVTGDNLEHVVEASQEFVKNMRDASTLTASSTKQIMLMVAEGKKLGVDSQINEILKASTDATYLITEANSQTQTLMFNAAANVNAVEDLWNGTLMQNREGQKKLAKGLKGLIADYDVANMSSDELKAMNLTLRSAYGMTYKQIELAATAMENTSKGLAETLTGLDTEMKNVNLTSERRKKLESDRNKMLTSAGFEVLTKFNEQVGMAGVTFEQAAEKAANEIRKSPDSFADLQAIGKEIGMNITEASSATDMWMAAGMETAKQIKDAGGKDLTSSLKAAIQGKDSIKVQDLLSQLSIEQQKLSMDEKKAADPITDLQHDVHQINEMLRQYVDAYSGFMLDLIGKTGLMLAQLSAMGMTLWHAFGGGNGVLGRVLDTVAGGKGKGAGGAGKLVKDKLAFVGDKFMEGAKYAKESMKEIFTKEKFKSFGDTLKSSAAYVKDRLFEGGGFLKKKFLETFTKENFAFAKDKLVEGVKLSKDYLIAGAKFAKDKFLEGGRFVKDRLFAGAKFLGDKLGSIFTKDNFLAMKGLFSKEGIAKLRSTLSKDNLMSGASLVKNKGMQGIKAVGRGVGTAAASAGSLLGPQIGSLAAPLTALAEGASLGSAAVGGLVIAVGVGLVGSIYGAAKAIEHANELFDINAAAGEKLTRRQENAAMAAGALTGFFNILTLGMFDALSATGSWTKAIAQFDAATGLVTAVLSPLIAAFKIVWNIIKGVGLLVWEVLVGAFEGLMAIITPVVDAISDIYHAIADPIAEMFGVSGGAGGIGAFFDMIFAGIDLIAPALQMLGKGLGWLLKGLGTIIGFLLKIALSPVVKFFQILGGVIGWIAKLVGGVVNKIVGFFSWMYDILIGHSIIPDLIFGIIEFFAMLPFRILKIIPELIFGIIKFFVSLPGKILKALPAIALEIIKFFAGLPLKIMGTLYDGITSTFAKLPEILFSGLTGALKAAWDWFKGYGQSSELKSIDAGNEKMMRQSEQLSAVVDNTKKITDPAERKAQLEELKFSASSRLDGLKSSVRVSQKELDASSMPSWVPMLGNGTASIEKNIAGDKSRMVPLERDLNNINAELKKLEGVSGSAKHAIPGKVQDATSVFSGNAVSGTNPTNKNEVGEVQPVHLRHIGETIKRDRTSSEAGNTTIKSDELTRIDQASQKQVDSLQDISAGIQELVSLLRPSSVVGGKSSTKSNRTRVRKKAKESLDYGQIGFGQPGQTANRQVLI